MPETTTLPPPLMTSEPGSFARYTIRERKPGILRQLIDDSDYPQEIVQELDALLAELATGPMRPLRENAPDAQAWNQAISSRRAESWHDIDWLFAETFFYRRILEAVRYFQPGPWERRDPFGEQKRAHDAIAVQQLADSWGQLASLQPAAACDLLLRCCLWGNQADLSYAAVAARASGGLDTGEKQKYLLIDHTQIARSFLASGLQRVAFINDNTGTELLCDLALADFLLVQGWVQEVVFHVKFHPFFVSDAMIEDVQAMVSLLKATDDTAMRGLGSRLHQHLSAQQLVLKDDAPAGGQGQGFWTSHHRFREMPPRLRRTLQEAGLVIIKGDANYRRLLGDRHWPHTTRLEDATAYFPAPFLTLRTLKSEVMVGLQPGQAAALRTEDPDWLVNGKRGIIQFAAGRLATCN